MYPTALLAQVALRALCLLRAPLVALCVLEGRINSMPLPVSRVSRALQLRSGPQAALSVYRVSMHLALHACPALRALCLMRVQLTVLSVSRVSMYPTALLARLALPDLCLMRVPLVALTVLKARINLTPLSVSRVRRDL